MFYKEHKKGHSRAESLMATELASDSYACEAPDNLHERLHTQCQR